MIQPVISIVAYNRPKSLKRLLSSIEQASFEGFSNIKLIISIDGNGEPEVNLIANDFNWKFGTKEIIAHSSNLGLKRHIISCGDLALKYDAVIVLEDDCFVSRNFYDYVCKALNYYETDRRIAGISLYSNRYNEMACLPFRPLHDGYDVFFMQIPSSWGQAWTNMQWNGFKNYYKTNPIIEKQDSLHESVKQWSDQSWKKLFYKYMIEYDLYFVYPQISYSTNFSDRGEHWNEDVSFFQVPLEFQIDPQYKFVSIDESLNIYDAYFELLAKNLIALGGYIDEDTCIDIYGSKQYDIIHNKYLLSSKKCSFPSMQFSAELFPLLENVIYKHKGHDISYSIKENFINYLSKNEYFQLFRKQRPIEFHFAEKTLYYKLGYLIMHPFKLIKKIIRTLS